MGFLSFLTFLVFFYLKQQLILTLNRMNSYQSPLNYRFMHLINRSFFIPPHFKDINLRLLIKPHTFNVRNYGMRI